MYNKIIFFDSLPEKTSEKTFPLGVLNLSSLVKDKIDTDFHYLPQNEASLIKLINNRKSIYCFSTICTTYPITIRYAKKIKYLQKDSLILLGGPQASATAQETMINFKWIDFITSGEAEYSFEALILSLLKQKYDDLISIPGLFWRKNGEVYSNPNNKIIDINKIKQPDYSLVSEKLTNNRIAIEAGRGCPFSCIYCSTSKFFGRNYRVKSIDNIISEIKRYKEEFLIKEFDFIHDMLLFDRNWILRLCEEILLHKINIKWNCSSRFDHLDSELLKKMKDAGCKGIFLGIESGSERMQKLIKKNLKINLIKEKIVELIELDISFVVSFIIGFPEETKLDLIRTLELYFEIATQRCGKKVCQLHLLSPLSDTVYANKKYDLVLDKFETDISATKIIQSEDYIQIKKYPYIFPNFYYIKNQQICRSIYRNIYFLMYFYNSFPSILNICFLKKKNDFLQLITSEYINSLQIDNSINSKESIKNAKNLVLDIGKHFNIDSKILSNCILYDFTLYNFKYESKQEHQVHDFEYNVVEIALGYNPRKCKDSVLFIRSADIVGAYTITNKLATMLV